VSLVAGRASQRPRPRVPDRCRRARWLVVLTALLVASAVARTASAADDPTLTWWTYESPHFRVTFPENLDAVAQRVAILSESIHARLVPEMQFDPGEKTEILVTDDSEGANGSASPIPYNAMRLYVMAPDDISTLGDYDDWLLGLITHEYTHILHTGNISGLARVANAIIGKTLAPNSAQPRWIIEGLAVVFESDYSSGGRIRSSLFDTWLRADVLGGNLARLDQISGGAERWPYGNMFYLYGSRFLRWVTDVYGPDTMPAVSADYGATTIPFGINRAIRRVTGRTYEDLYDAWAEHLKRHYGKQAAAVDALGRREGVRITFHGREADYPRFVPTDQRKDPAAVELLYYRDDYSTTSGLYRIALGDPKKSGDRDAELFIRTGTDAYAAFAPDGHVVFNDLAPWKNLYTRTDLFTLPPREASTHGTEPTRRRLTEGQRAWYPDVSPDGRLVTFVVNSKGSTTLSLADRSSDGRLTNVRALVHGATFDQAFTPRFSPNGKQIAYSAWRHGGYRDILVADVATGKTRELMRDRSLDMQPVWSSDGRTIFFSSDRTGIFNVYAHDVETGVERMVTNVLGAALAPAVSPDGKTLVYVGYTHEGYDLFAFELDPVRFLPAPAAPDDRPAPYAEPAPIKLEKERYNPLVTLRPYSYFLDVGPGNYSANAITLTASGADLLGHHGLGASIRIDPGAPEPRIDLDYVYGGLPVSFGRAALPRQSAPRPRTTASPALAVPYDEYVNGIHDGRLVPHRRQPSAATTSSLSYAMARSSAGTLPVGTRARPVRLAPRRRRKEGTLGQRPHVGYGLSRSNAEGSSRRAGARAQDASFGVGPRRWRPRRPAAPRRCYAVRRRGERSTFRCRGSRTPDDLRMRVGGGHLRGHLLALGRQLLRSAATTSRTTALLDTHHEPRVRRRLRAARVPGGLVTAGNARTCSTRIEYRFPIAVVNSGPSRRCRASLQPHRRRAVHRLGRGLQSTSSLDAIACSSADELI
jgi:hypothetical protein